MQRILANELAAIVGPEAVLHSPEDLMLYEYDGSVELATPEAVVFPSSTAEVVALVRWAKERDIPIVARGAGTGLSGGAVAVQGGLVLGFSRMKRILEVDIENQRAVVQPGVVNLDLSQAVAASGYYYAPDPSSQKACTIGGNVAENSGGPHTLAYGVTTNHVLGLEAVLPEGEVIHTGGKGLDCPGYDLTGVLVGSEGTLGIVTQIIVRLMRLPEAVKTLLAIFETVDDASETVAEITARAITPAALEMMDQLTLQAVEEATKAGYPRDAAAVLLIELEGPAEGVEVQAEQIAEVCRRHRAREVRVAQSERERLLLWAGRKNAFGAMGRITTSYYVQDGVIPRTRIPETLRFVREVSERTGLRIANVFHAGDGNLHPIILFDARDREQFRRVVQAGAEILSFCVSIGGSLTGEHGIGMEKNELMPLLFTEDDLTVMGKLKAVFNPDGRLNPAKVFPTTKGCGEVRVPPQVGVVRSAT
ncbi:MAG: glycolate oxidase subunit GlcD [Acidobacteria bacterium RIFCSPLOWO2_12_FULL_60_22]|nr:MAG: glycolate oxidase subunit GlcD [Acidobacteria bacterium RIFCSPLOWO2_12_FULL_60_22]